MVEKVVEQVVKLVGEEYRKEVETMLKDFFSPFPKVKELVGDVDEETVAAITKTPFVVDSPNSTLKSQPR